MKIRALYVLAILVLIASVASAQQEQMDEKAMMDAMMKAATPGEPHKKLEPFVGNWNVSTKMWAAPGAPATEGTGSASARWVLGGRYIEQQFNGNFMGMPFSGLGYTGYDNVKKQYVGTWMDSFSTGVMFSAGAADSSGKVMAFASTMEDPATGKSVRMDEKITILDNDKHIMEMWMPGPDGKAYKMMELTYTRKK
jgi:uncharacterized protein DUF1579